MSFARNPDGVTIPLERAARATQPLAAVIRVLDAPARPATFALDVGHCRIGSGAGCDLTVEHGTVSRAHVELALVSDGVVVQDLGSRNGTFYLGQRVDKITLALGSRIQLGAVTVVIDADAQSLEDDLLFEGTSYNGALGVSVAMRRVLGIAKRLEGSLVTVLIQGESGTGKDVLARALHQGSSVAAGPFVTLNCGALPRDIVSSELFGHRKGAFTGATDTRKGAFESADGGTLFLDEIGELPLDVQPTLLRVLETGEAQRVGDDSARRVKVRVIAATNRDLDAAVADGRFREDLFYRLAVVRLQLPPLRERPDDVEPLALAFARQAGLDTLPPSILEQLKARPWPGNAREVRNAVQAFAALGVIPAAGRPRGAALDLALRDLVDPHGSYAAQKEALADRFTAIYLEALLESTGGNQTAAARIADMDRGYLGRLVSKYKVTMGR